MKMTRLAFMNFKNSFKSYLSLVISLAFTILILFNFQNIIYSDTFAVLGQRNKEYIDMLVQVISVVLGCFMFFFIWYATNVFLTRRKREIGIYVFMGLSNRKIGGLYMIEISFVGIAAFVMGIGFGVLAAGLFQMIMLAISDIAADITFQLSLEPVKVTAIIFFIMYLLFALKGYWNITHSSVLSMISAARQNEYVRMKKPVLLIKAVLGVFVLGSGYYLANKSGRYLMMENLIAATILVIVGVYLLFGGLIPLIFQALAGNKYFLYCRQRCLWVNQVIFRMKKNYRTYAIVCILGVCAVTALATGFAMRGRYYGIIEFENQYTFQLLSNQDDLYEKAAELIQSKSEISYQMTLPTLCPDDDNLVLSYSDVKRIAKQVGIAFSLPEPEENEVVKLSHLILLSLYTQQGTEPVSIAGKTYRQIENVRLPYLGYLQKSKSFYIVSDSEYERLKQQSTELYIYSYQIADASAFTEARTAIDELVSNTDENFTARVAVDPQSDEIEWIKVLHSLCIFMFLVFIVAGGCIMFMKLYNDSFEEKERYLVLKKLGFSSKILSKSIARELLTAYILPFAVMTISAFFSVHALEKMMRASLFTIYLVSIFVVWIVFVLCYFLSVAVYRRNV